MTQNEPLEIFLVTVPGLEAALCGEARALGFKDAKVDKGGVTVMGSWADVWRANLMLRGASQVLVRLGAFRVMHLAKLDKAARRFPWGETLRADMPVRVEATCKKSRIYHHKAAAERIETAIREEFGGTISADADVCIKVRIFDDMCTISIDTSGEGLHKRGFKEAVNKAPMRETLAALLLRECGFKGSEPVVDPMCGSGTFVIEAAEIAMGLAPGRARTFTFEQLATFDAAAYAKLKDTLPGATDTSAHFFGYDRDGGAIKMSAANAERAGVSGVTNFERKPISELVAPEGDAGLVIINPPYGMRIGEVKKLRNLYQALGTTLTANFKGWRVGIVTNNDELARATSLKFRKAKTRFSHGGIPVTLYQTSPLA